MSRARIAEDELKDEAHCIQDGVVCYTQKDHSLGTLMRREDAEVKEEEGQFHKEHNGRVYDQPNKQFLMLLSQWSHCC